MQCPKCNSGSFLSEEELVKVIEGTEPQRIIIRSTHTCMACHEKFSRLVWDELGPHRRHVQPQMPYQQAQQVPNPYQPQQPQHVQQKQDEPVVDGLKFF